ncbi:MAG: ABC transporter ATP-binding protein [Ignavibacteria bacterium]|nr:ABC transporter ATP-binding protein [Ignavibacteria bacterium]
MKDLRPLIKYLRKYRKKLYAGFVFIVISISIQSLYPLVIGRAVDDLTGGVLRYSLLTYALFSIGLVILSGIFLFMIRQTIIVTSRDIENDLRNDFLTKLQFLSKSFFDKNSTGDIMARATNDINNVRNFIGPGIMYSVQTFFRTTITLAILISISPSITLISLLPLPFITLLVYRVMKYTYNRSLLVQESFSAMTTKAQESFSGIRVIKSYVREKFEISEFNRISEDYQKKNLSLARIQSYSFPMMFMFTGLSVILVIYFGGLGVIGGTFTIGNIASFLVYLNQLTFPMIALGWVINLIQRASPSMNRLTKIMNTLPEVADAKSDSFKGQFKITGGIEFKAVKFKYPGTDRIVLENINLTIPAGSTLGIIGHTGAGKSSLINLITRLYDVTEGEVLIDGINIKDIPLPKLREAIGIVPQESFLFSDSIIKNITYSESVTDESRAVEASKIAGLYKDVETFPDKFYTHIGERGITLSGGQKQRAALARAIYKNPGILILDDSLSAVDTNTEEEILKKLKAVMKNRTSIIISHRISTIKNADNIIVLSDGLIAEQGTHTELIEKTGTYNDIYQRQLLEEEIKEIE